MKEVIDACAIPIQFCEPDLNHRQQWLGKIAELQANWPMQVSDAALLSR